jgi:transcriptional regulator with XRE-family HTH domain
MTMDAKELKRWRARQGLSQAKLAAELGVHVMTVSKWEQGQRRIPPFLGLALEALKRKLEGQRRAGA